MIAKGSLSKYIKCPKTVKMGWRDNKQVIHRKENLKAINIKKDAQPH